ncbi:hypothetical protein PHMEG_00036686, partial [Phytophthora megakarya]
MSREPDIVLPPDLYYPELHHWSIWEWLLEKKETIRHLREITSASSSGRSWTANLRSECLHLPVVTDPLALRVNLEELRFDDGTRDSTSVVAVLQTMLHDAGYGFRNLVPTWGCTWVQFMSYTKFLWELLVFEQSAWNEIAHGSRCGVRSDDVPFKVLNTEAAAVSSVGDNGTVSLLTPDDQALLGASIVNRLRLTYACSPNEPVGDTSSPETSRVLLGVLRSRSDKLPSGLNGSVPEDTRNSSLASGDVSPLALDGNVKSSRGASKGSHGLEST